MENVNEDILESVKRNMSHNQSLLFDAISDALSATYKNGAAKKDFMMMQTIETQAVTKMWDVFWLVVGESRK